MSRPSSHATPHAVSGTLTKTTASLEIALQAPSNGFVNSACRLLKLCLWFQQAQVRVYGAMCAYRIASGPARKPHRMGLSFTYKNRDFEGGFCNRATDLESGSIQNGLLQWRIQTLR